MHPYSIKNAQQSQGGRTINVRTPWYVRIMTERYPYDFNNLAIAVRMPYDHPKGLRLSLFLFQNYDGNPCGDRIIITGFPYGTRTMLPTTCLRATVLRFLKICKSADYYKIVQATEIVESRRIEGNRRPNVTLALQDTISKYGLLRGQSFHSHV